MYRGYREGGGGKKNIWRLNANYCDDISKTGRLFTTVICANESNWINHSPLPCSASLSLFLFLSIIISHARSKYHVSHSRRSRIQAQDATRTIRITRGSIEFVGERNRDSNYDACRHERRLTWFRIFAALIRSRIEKWCSPFVRLCRQRSRVLFAY